MSKCAHNFTCVCGGTGGTCDVCHCVCVDGQGFLLLVLVFLLCFPLLLLLLTRWIRQRRFQPAYSLVAINLLSGYRPQLYWYDACTHTLALLHHCAMRSWIC